MLKKTCLAICASLAFFLSVLDLEAQDRDPVEEGKKLDTAQEWAQRLRFVVESTRYKIEQRGLGQLLRDYRDGAEWRLRKSLQEIRDRLEERADGADVKAIDKGADIGPSADGSVEPGAVEKRVEYHESLKEAREVSARENRLLVIKVGAKW